MLTAVMLRHFDEKNAYSKKRSLPMQIAKRVAAVMGKHNKSITCGAWSEANLLALGSEDRTLSISNVEGDTLRVATLRAEPSDIQFSEMKQV
jgi:WD repeat-containing protein 19